MPITLNNLKRVHFIAICGTGMGSLAELFKNEGIIVTGSDQNIYPPMSTQLEALQIPVFLGFSANNLEKTPDLVIIGNAVSKENPEVVAVLEKKIPFMSMPEALGTFFIAQKKSIVVSGTHGKTTTTALLSHLLTELKSNPSFLIGGILQDNLPNCRLGKGPYFVIEGDEYDTSCFDKGPKFLHYRPFITLITSLEFDHADIYRDLNHLTESFRKLLQITPANGQVHLCSHYNSLIQLADEFKTTHPHPHFYGWKNLQPHALLAKDIVAKEGLTHFNLHQVTQVEPLITKNLGAICSPMAGEHNVLNLLACFSILLAENFKLADIQKALLNFKGVKRRQEIRGKVADHLVVDDFAHHPTAVKETIAALKARYPQHQLVALFEPRSNSSKRDVFQKDYATAFGNANVAIISDVFMPEKVKDGKILNVDQLVDEIQSQSNNRTQAYRISTTEKMIECCLQLIDSKKPTLFLIMSNGSFGGIHEKLLTALKTTLE